MNQIWISFLISCILHQSYGELHDDTLVNLFKDAVNKNITSEKCLIDINIFLKRLNETRNEDSWALKMLAASAKVPETILAYEYGDLGHIKKCVEIESQQDKILGKYCIGNVYPTNNDTIENSQQLETRWSSWAFCIPSNCTNEDFNRLMHKFHFFDIGIINSSIICQTHEDTHPKFSGDAVLGFTGFGILLLILISSTCFDIVYSPSNKTGRHRPLLTAFSVYANGKKLFSAPRRSSNLSCLDGLKVLNLACIILFHTVLLSTVATFVIKKDAVQFKESLLYFIIRNGAILAVDSFFMSGGLLVTYLYFKKEKLQNITVAGVLKHYLHRWIRLAPGVAGVIFFNVTLMKYIGSGPTWPYNVKKLMVQDCVNYWYLNLLFIQNEIIPHGDDECLGYTWYLDVDLQVYLFSPLIFFLLKKYFKIGVALISAACVASLSLAIVQGNSNDSSYYHTEARITPLLMGNLLGYALTRKRLTDIRFSKKINLLLWILSFIVIIICAIGGNQYIMYNENFEFQEDFVEPLRKIFFVLAVGWIVWACSTNQGGIVNDLLSLPVFQYLSKFSYSMYIIHCPLVYCSISSITTLYETTFLNLGLWYFWIYISAFLLSIVWVLTFEMPWVNVENYVFSK